MKKMLFLLFLASCAPKYKYTGDAEIVCPLFGESYIIEGVSSLDVYDAIERFIRQEIREHNDHHYTVLKFKDGSSLELQKIGPRDLAHCTIHDVNHSYEKTYFEF